MSKPFEAGETVLLLDGKGRRYLVGLEAGGTFHSHAGFVRHEEVLGQPEGVSISPLREPGSRSCGRRSRTSCSRCPAAPG